MKPLTKTCLTCGINITGSHFNRKRCEPCASNIAKESSRTSIKRWKANNPERVKELNKTWYDKFPVKKRLSHAREIARRRGYKCSLTNDELIEHWGQPCIYCGADISQDRGIGLDRIDNNIGYVLDNVVPCCGPCNNMRNVFLTHEEMKVAMKAILEYRGNNGRHIR